MNKVEVFVQVGEEIEELETVEKVLYSAMEKEKLKDTSFNLIIVDNKYIYNNIKYSMHKVKFAISQSVQVLSSV